MADDEPEIEVNEEETAAPEAPAPGEPMDILTALQLVLKKSLAHHGLARGLRESCKVRAAAPAACAAGRENPRSGLRPPPPDVPRPR